MGGEGVETKKKMTANHGNHQNKCPEPGHRSGANYDSRGREGDSVDSRKKTNKKKGKRRFAQEPERRERVEPKQK